MFLYRFVSQSKKVWLPRNKRQTYWFYSRHQMCNQVWSWWWPKPSNTKVKYGICCISTKNYSIAMKWIWISIEHLASNVAISFDLGHDLDLGFSRSNFIIAVSQKWQGWLTLSVIHNHDRDLLVTKVRCQVLTESDRGDLRFWCAVDLTS